MSHFPQLPWHTAWKDAKISLLEYQVKELEAELKLFKALQPAHERALDECIELEDYLTRLAGNTPHKWLQEEIDKLLSRIQSRPRKD